MLGVCLASPTLVLLGRLGLIITWSLDKSFSTVEYSYHRANKLEHSYAVSQSNWTIYKRLPLGSASSVRTRPSSTSTTTRLVQVA